MYFYSCDPLTNGEIANKNQVAPYWLLSALNRVPALGGITLASALCAGMMVHSSGMVSISNSIMDDLLQPLSISKLYENNFYKKFIGRLQIRQEHDPLALLLVQQLVQLAHIRSLHPLHVQQVRQLVRRFGQLRVLRGHKHVARLERVGIQPIEEPRVPAQHVRMH